MLTVALLVVRTLQRLEFQTLVVEEAEEHLGQVFQIVPGQRAAPA